MQLCCWFQARSENGLALGRESFVLAFVVKTGLSQGMDILQRIVRDKATEVSLRKERLPRPVLDELLHGVAPARDFVTALSIEGRNIIAEVKRASPSKGILKGQGDNQGWQPTRLAQAYQAGGARAVSVLTDTPYFWGSMDDFAACRQVLELPMLRKDFIIEPYQVDESRWLGADAVLLMASVLSEEAMGRCLEQVYRRNMGALLEVHSAEEL